MQAIERERSQAKRRRSALPDRLDIAEYRNRVWVTRPRPGVDRFASAWLVRRFIDQKAAFVFAASPDRYPSAVPFDMYQTGGFKHEGDLCTFEVLQERFGIRELAVTRIAQLVHDIDLKEDRYNSPHAPTVSAQVDEGRELELALDEARLITPHGGVAGEQGFRLLNERVHAAAAEQRKQVVAAADLVGELDFRGFVEPVEQCILAGAVGMFAELDQDHGPQALLGQLWGEDCDGPRDPAFAA